METVNQILRQKASRRLLCAQPSETVLETTRRMNDYGVGAMLIMEDDRIVGIFTERDVLRRIVVEERVPSQVSVGEVMTTEVACVTLDTTIDEAQNLMRQYRIRHAPVVDCDGEVKGILSIGDLNAYHASKQEVAVHFLYEYLHGRV